MKFKIAFSCALLAGAAVPAAAAQTVVVDTITPMPGYKVGTIHSLPPGTGIGPLGYESLSVEVTPFNFRIISPSTYDIVTYCIDIAHYLYDKSTYEVSTIDALPNVAAQQVALLRVLTNSAVPGADPLLEQTDTAKAAGIQLAIWEILNETGAAWDISSGTFFADGGNLNAVAAPPGSKSALQYAGQYLDIAKNGSVSGNYGLRVLSNGLHYPSGLGPANQNQIFMVALPEPATWGMMISGFGLIGASLRARRRQALPAQA